MPAQDGAIEEFKELRSLCRQKGYVWEKHCSSPATEAIDSRRAKEKTAHPWLRRRKGRGADVTPSIHAEYTCKPETAQSLAPPAAQMLG